MERTNTSALSIQTQYESILTLFKELEAVPSIHESALKAKEVFKDHIREKKLASNTAIMSAIFVDEVVKDIADPKAIQLANALVAKYDGASLLQQTTSYLTSFFSTQAIDEAMINK